MLHSLFIFFCLSFYLIFNFSINYITLNTFLYLNFFDSLKLGYPILDFNLYTTFLFNLDLLWNISCIFFFGGFSILAIFSGFMVIFSRNPIHSIFFLILSFLSVSGLLFLLKLEFLPIIFLIVYVGAVSVLFLFVVMMLNIKIIELIENFFNYLPIGASICILLLIELYFFIISDLDTSLSIFFIINKDFSNLFNDLYFQYINELNYIYIESLSILDTSVIISLDTFFESYIFETNQNNIFYNWNINFINYINELDSILDIESIAQILYEHNFIVFFLAAYILLVAMLGAIVLTLNINKDKFSVKKQNISTQVYRNIKLKIHTNKI